MIGTTIPSINKKLRTEESNYPMTKQGDTIGCLQISEREETEPCSALFYSLQGQENQVCTPHLAIRGQSVPPTPTPKPSQSLRYPPVSSHYSWLFFMSKHPEHKATEVQVQKLMTLPWNKPFTQWSTTCLSWWPLHSSTALLQICSHNTSQTSEVTTPEEVTFLLCFPLTGTIRFNISIFYYLQAL